MYLNLTLFERKNTRLSSYMMKNEKKKNKCEHKRIVTVYRMIHIVISHEMKEKKKYVFFPFPYTRLILILEY